MRLGGPVFKHHNSPEDYARAHVEKGYREAFCPDGLKPGDTQRNHACREALLHY